MGFLSSVKIQIYSPELKVKMSSLQKLARTQAPLLQGINEWD